MVIKVKSSELDSLKIYLSCPKKKDCDDNCCQKAQEVLENGSVPSIRQIATQILVLHEFEFSASILENKDCLLAYLQVEEISKVISFLTNQDVDVLTSFNVQELDLILNRFKKSFAKNPKLFLPENVFEKFWSSLFYTGVDTWKNWRRVFTTLLELKKDDALVSDDFNTKLFKRIHPNLPWMLKIKYQALTVLIPKVPKII
uniref:Uncharacterized protein n=1 Tax=Panagrolaimus sp. JU765 TaxID=591449 RepID=A0AC34RNQ7_9BILA